MHPQALGLKGPEEMLSGHNLHEKALPHRLLDVCIRDYFRHQDSPSGGRSMLEPKAIISLI